MKPTKQRKPLKKPAKQDRAKATIAAILQAATHVLVKEGYEGANTNRIAEVAGVSIGSVYQYFANKEAIIGELIESHIQKLMNVFVEKYNTLGTASLKDGIRILIRAMIEARSVEPKLQRVFDEQLPKIGKLSQFLSEYEKQAVEMIIHYLHSKKKELAIKNIEIAAFIAVHAVEEIILVALSNRHDLLTSGQLEDELTNLMTSYLVKDVRR